LEILFQVSIRYFYYYLDLSLNIALANNGFAEMGIAGSIAGPLFNLLTGSGIVMLKTNLES